MIKHYRHSAYEYANQSNAFYAVSGLITLNLYLYRLVANKVKGCPVTHPKLFDSSVFPPYLLCAPEKDLPDFEVTP
jgi:hypothetical protein